jgi:hypothetical protein
MRLMVSLMNGRRRRVSERDSQTLRVAWSVLAGSRASLSTKAGALRHMMVVLVVVSRSLLLFLISRQTVVPHDHGHLSLPCS